MLMLHLDLCTNRFVCSLALHLSNTKANHRHLHTEIVASCRDYRPSRFEMHSILPCRSVSSKVINIVTAYMCETESECWYLPTQFGDIAKSYEDPSKVQVGVGTTINICRLQRFYQRLQQCNKIFMPLYDELLEHRYLLVMNIAGKKRGVVGQQA